MPGGLYDAWIRAVVSSEEIAAQPDPLAEWIDTYDAQTGNLIDKLIVSTSI